MHYGLADYLKADSPALSQSLDQFDALIGVNLPQLHSHLKNQNFLPMMYAVEWLTTLFVCSVSIDTAARILDVFLVKSNQVGDRMQTPVVLQT